MTKTYATIKKPTDSVWITPNKLYPVLSFEDYPEYNSPANRDAGFLIRDDDNSLLFCLWEGCAHLDGEDWTKVELEENEERNN